jgi:mannitol/fructose-specific phosphotransferase system IIA component (Ntr-type)
MNNDIIRNLIKNQTVTLFLESNSKEDILNEIAENISFSKKNYDHLEILNGLKEREAKASTGTECGVAIPHTTISKIKDTKLFLFLSKKGIPFDSFDSIPSKIFFVILSPNPPIKPIISNLNIMGNICRTMRIESIRNQIILANNLQEILKSLEGN